MIINPDGTLKDALAKIKNQANLKLVKNLLFGNFPNIFPVFRQILKIPIPTIKFSSLLDRPSKQYL